MTGTSTSEVARIPPLARRLLAATLLSALGNGLVLPFLVVYLHDVRGLSTAFAGLVVAWEALVGFALAPLGGALIDRLGPRPVMLVGPLVLALGTTAMAFARTAPQALGAASLLAVGSAGLWPAGATMMARLVPDELRQRAFGIQFMLLNLGIGLGGLAAGSVVNTAQASTFEVLYVANATTFLGYAVIVATMRGVGGPIPPEPGADEGGYRDVLRDRAMVQVALVALVALTCGYGAIEIGYPAFATQVAGVSPRLVALGFVANTVTIVLGQLFVLRRIEGHSRARVLALVGALWAVSWLLLGLSGAAGGTVVVAALLLATPVLFAVGETLWQPVLPALVNDLAPEALRGRYNAFSSLTWLVAGMLGPAVAGLLIGAGHATAWVVVVVVGCLVASLLALRLRRVLTPVQDGGRLAP